MKSRLIQLIALSVLIAGSVFGAYPEEDAKSVRLDLVMDEHTFNEAEVGGEIGFAVAVFNIDQLGLFANYKGYNGQQFKSIGVFVEENYLANKPVNPFIGAGVGYAWTEPKNADTDKDVYFRLQAGLKVPLSKHMAISAMLSYSICSDDIFLEDEALTDNIIELSLGMRFYY